MWDAVGSILVGGLLGCIAMFLVQRNRDLLLGRSMSPGEMQVTDTKTEEIGPGVFRFKAEVAWNGDQLVERYLQRWSGSGTVQHEHAACGEAGSPLDRVLKSYGRDIISAVGAEVDRIELEIQAINPGIRFVDLETDRGRSGPYLGPDLLMRTAAKGIITKRAVRTPGHSAASASVPP
ncbi:uncharacterized protein HaLaN_07421, partial [Haematococcus lacustris]